MAFRRDREWNLDAWSRLTITTIGAGSRERTHVIPLRLVTGVATEPMAWGQEGQPTIWRVELYVAGHAEPFPVGWAEGNEVEEFVSNVVRIDA